MKLKGISLVEQHVEKFVLALALAGLVVVGVLQFVRRPNAVDVGREQVAPGQVDPMLRQKAEALATRLSEEARPDPDPFAQPAPRVFEDFRQAIAGRVSDGQKLARLAPALGGSLLPIDLGADTWYYEPALAAPVMLAQVVQSADALTEEIVSAHPDLAARFADNPSGPKDIVWTVPAAVIDPKAIREELRRSDPSASPARAQVPTPWYNDSLYIADVVFEREELLPDGTWGQLVTVSPLPGQPTLRPRLEGPADAALRNELFAMLGDPAMQAQLLQPDFLPTRNEAFVPPALPSADEGADTDTAENADVEYLMRLKADRSRKNEELARLGGPVKDETGQRDDTRGKDEGREERGKGGGLAPPGGGSGDLGRGGTRRRPGETGEGTEGDRERNRGRRLWLTKEIQKLDERIAQLEAELKGTIGESTEADVAEGGVDLTGDDPVLVWCHDIGVQPGKIYRYRCAIRVYNPFFARERQLVKEQAPLASSIVMTSAKSGWSAPVEVTPPVAFFVVRANPGEGVAGLGTARVEVFRLHDGKWRREEFTVSPGDRIGRSATLAGAGGDPASAGGAGGGPVSVDFSTDWFVVDVIEDRLAERRPGSESQRPGLLVVERIGGGRTEVREPQEDQKSADRSRLHREWKVGSVS